MWQVAIEIARRAGGDRGCIGLMGPAAPPAAMKPERLIGVETEGWSIVDDAKKTGFDTVLEQLRRAGITLIRRADHKWVEALEQSIADGRAICNSVTSWENRWYQRGIVDQNPDGVSARAKATLAKAEAMTPDDYRVALLARQTAQATHAMMAPFADAAITLACPGPAPLWSGDVPGQPLAPRPTGDFVFNAPSSMLFAPVVTVPLMSVGGMPVGVQVMGQQGEDARMTALARWLATSVKPVATPA
jgi:Asp-tRNA(Asn)/Glu-tRNA(Gln) amidotransferase A subunit family amidase